MACHIFTIVINMYMYIGASLTWANLWFMYCTRYKYSACKLYCTYDWVCSFNLHHVEMLISTQIKPDGSVACSSFIPAKGRQQTTCKPMQGNVTQLLKQGFWGWHPRCARSMISQLIKTLWGGPVTIPKSKSNALIRNFKYRPYNLITTNYSEKTLVRVY